MVKWASEACYIGLESGKLLEYVRYVTMASASAKSNMAKQSMSSYYLFVFLKEAFLVVRFWVSGRKSRMEISEEMVTKYQNDSNR